ncbi:MAG: hypothetical protein BWY83_03369 [bacterium ADurb.Bin478]|nr:MAG: hypothetical protein BWY83_03369 [bacterium ADurb.Bin478]
MIHCKHDLCALGVVQFFLERQQALKHLLVIHSQRRDHVRAESGHGGGAKAVFFSIHFQRRGGRVFCRRQKELKAAKDLFRLLQFTILRQGFACLRQSGGDAQPGGRQIRVVQADVLIGQQRDLLQPELCCLGCEHGVPAGRETAAATPRRVILFSLLRQVHDNTERPVLFQHGEHHPDQTQPFSLR